MPRPLLVVLATDPPLPPPLLRTECMQEIKFPKKSRGSGASTVTHITYK